MRRDDKPLRVPEAKPVVEQPMPVSRARLKYPLWVVVDEDGNIERESCLCDKHYGKERDFVGLNFQNPIWCQVDGADPDLVSLSCGTCGFPIHRREGYNDNPEE